MNANPTQGGSTIAEIVAPFQLVITGHGGGDEKKLAVVVNDFEIHDPQVSECGRFTVDPQQAYGMSTEQCAALADLNSLLDRAGDLTPDRAAEMVHAQLGTSALDSDPNTAPDLILQLVVTGRARSNKG